jgi:hypothetical protein
LKIGGFIGVLFELKKLLEVFCDFVLVFGLKFHEELNVGEG